MRRIPVSRVTLAFVGLSLLSCSDLKATGRMALRDVSMATPQTQEAYRRSQAAIEDISAQDERALGEAVALQIVNGAMRDGQPTGLELRDRELASYVASVGNLVALQGTRQIFPPRTTPRLKARRFVFGILDTPSVGAFSTPGGYIFVTRGLLEKLETESELAWVLGHEIAHVDYEDGLVALKTNVATTAAAKSLSEALKAPRKPGESEFQNQDFFNQMVDRLYGVYDQTGFNKDYEIRSDRVGLEYSTAAGYDGNGAIRALDHLELGTTVGGFISHGSRSQRIEAMKALLDKPGRTAAARYDRMALARVEALAMAAPAPAATPATAGGTQ